MPSTRIAAVMIHTPEPAAALAWYQRAVPDRPARHRGRAWLGAWERNPRAVAFDVKSGFAKVGSHDFVVGSDRQTDRVFVGPLRPPAGDPA